MKKSGILNSDISRVLSYMRHTDTICISDCGLPCPDKTELIDVSLERGVPNFVQVLTVIVNDMSVERILLAEEICVKNPAVLKEIRTLLPDIRIDFVPHEEFKKNLLSCKAVVRSGEATPYANIILQSGCLF